MSTDVDFSSTLTTSEWISLVLSFLGLPLSLTLSLLTSPFSPRNQSKPTGRIIRDDMMRYFVDRLSMRQVRAVLPNSQSAYEAWARSEGVGSVVDEVGGGSRVFWVGERPGRRGQWGADKHSKDNKDRKVEGGGEKVLVYCHGGGYWCPMNPHQIRFMQRIRKELALSGIRTSIAVVPYSLYPATYPTQVNDLTRVVNYILSLGVEPSNIQFVGDSAGGNLILQFLSQWLHPDVKNGVAIAPPSPSNTNVSANTNTNKDTNREPVRPKFGGAVLISPWVSLDPTSPSQISNDPFDSITSRGLREWGRAYMAPLLQNQSGAASVIARAYVDPVYASTLGLKPTHGRLDSKAEAEAWWTRAGGCIPRFLITVGGKECLRDDIIYFARTLRAQTRMQPPTLTQTRPPTPTPTLIPTPTQTGTAAVDVTLDIQPDGVHIDPFPDYATRLASGDEIGVVMERIVKWLRVGFGGGYGYNYGEVGKV